MTWQRESGDWVHVWPMADHGYFFIALSEAYPVEALHEFARLFGRVAAALTACREHERVRQLALAQRVSNRVFELAPMGVMVTDVEQRILDVNPAFCRTTGYRRDEVIGRTPKLLASGRHDADFYRRVWHDIEHHGHWTGEIWNRKKNGQIYAELITIMAVSDGDGTVKSYVGVFVDISAQKAREGELMRLRDALRSSRDRLRAILDNLGEGVYTLDAQGRCTYFNATAQRLLGWTQEEVLGRNLHELIHHHTPDGRDLPEALCPIRRAFREGEIYRSEDEVFFHKDGTPIPVRAVGAPLYEEGRLVASVAVFDDISKQKALEAGLRAAKEAAEQLARMKSEFLSVMSHEIRTPLNGVIGAIDLLLGTPLDAEQLEFARTIRASAETLLALINDILDFSKLEAGAVHLEAVPTDLALLARATVDIVRPALNGKPVELALTTPQTPLPWVLADPGRLRQVLLNLLSNAVKFTEQGEVRLVVAADAPTQHRSDDAAPRLHVRMEVHDTGIGMSEAVQTRLFRAFEQGDASVTRRYGGTGLGLAITKRLVDLMGGRIEVSSAPGRGTTFRVFLDLPMCQEQTLAAGLPQAAQAAAEAKGRALSLSVLLVEDNPVNQRVAARMLERLGCRVAVASNGEEALARYAETPAPLIFMDCQMPVMDGFAATAALRERTGGRRPPVVVALTANADEADRQRCLAAGMDDYLAKPISLDRIRDVLARWEAQCAQAPAGAPLTASADGDKSLFDAARVASLFGDDPNFLREMTALFLENARSILDRLDGAHAASPPDWTTVSALAHEIKGSADNLGLLLFRDVAQQLAAAARARRIDALRAARADLVRAIARLHKWEEEHA
jgi:PAS domain S-box-containing protein